jgi:hypothetical protein
VTTTTAATLPDAPGNNINKDNDNDNNNDNDNDDSNNTDGVHATPASRRAGKYAPPADAAAHHDMVHIVHRADDPVRSSSFVVPP